MGLAAGRLRPPTPCDSRPVRDFWALGRFKHAYSLRTGVGKGVLCTDELLTSRLIDLTGRIGSFSANRAGGHFLLPHCAA